MSGGKSPAAPNWWQTVPGILTGLAAIITAVTGLFLALNHTGNRNEPVQPSSTSSGTSTTSPGAASSAAAKTTASGTAGTGGASGTKTIALPALNRVKLAGGSAVFTILSAQIEPLDLDRRSLKFAVRYLNAGRYPANFWSSSFRLIIDDVPRAPTNLLDEVVASESAKDGDVVFELPVSVKDVMLQFGSGDDSSRLPFKLP
jgi:hypothetical protein